MSLTLEKTKRYDRQIRLWGENGQIVLENSKVCLIGSGCIGSEILKNLILPGIGSFTIVDDYLVNEEDLSNNFFVQESDINQPRAEVTARLLRDLNEDVIINHIDDSVESLLARKPEFFLEFSVVIACGLNNKDLVDLDRLLYPENIGLIVCHSIGMVANLRVIIKEHPVVEAKPDNLKPDLRLDKPLIEFVEFCNSQNLDQMSHKDLAYCPWVVILYKYLQIFQQQMGGWPESYKDRQILRQMIKDGGEKYQKLVASKEELSPSEYLDSFEEACRSISTATIRCEIPINVRALLDDPRCININRESKSFWVLVAALKDFIKWEGNGSLPLRGDIPDMTADTERYVNIQRIYRLAADKDVLHLEKHVLRLCQTFQIPISDELCRNNIARFARNCQHIQILSSYSLERELKTSPTHTDELVCPETDELSWYLTLRAAVSFFTVERRWPGQRQIDYEIDVSHLRKLLQQDLNACAKLKDASVKDDFLLEMCRFSGVQLHSVCAFIAGVAAQEVIKLITGQYVPVMQPLMYNAIRQTTNLIDI